MDVVVFGLKNNMFNNIIGTENEVRRKRWLINVLKRIPKNSNILDAGAGEQQYKKFCKHLKYTSQDFAEYIPTNVKSGFQMNKWNYGKLDIISDISKIPVRSKYFDAVMCTEVFEHLPNPILAIKEFSRIIKDGGYLIITAPFCSLTHFAPYYFATGFSKYYYEKNLTENGFKIIEISPNGNYFDYLAQENRRLVEMMKKYTNLPFRLLFPILKIIEFVNLILLNLLSKHNSGSEEVLCFGYHVLAVKK